MYHCSSQLKTHDFSVDQCNVANIKVEINKQDANLMTSKNKRSFTLRRKLILKVCAAVANLQEGLMQLKRGNQQTGIASPWHQHRRLNPATFTLASARHTCPRYHRIFAQLNTIYLRPIAATNWGFQKGYTISHSDASF